ncbi:methylated-DNA--[protein]-cysteine S-methyltransferase [Nitrosomonas sp. JL21]|uniref:methylated-DNA--[protein]-cysteine S-methyltransferase n=1 Tax=Nitrosomonas sp. JL21 TaxID=153949 RepID=UPI00136EB97D|nr:methylated-DNA--[protein]-cysteine S-methyltransferase [Nitrosomonas sp.]MXS77486.1 methylated-DNA--[protein]-cysteine S-methyltransferase [Nitrosomonas sp. JL21]
MNKSKSNQSDGSVRNYQAKLITPFAVLGIIIEEDWLTDIDYLPLDVQPMAPQGYLAKEVCRQLQAYLVEPTFKFDLSLHIGGTTHQRRVWQAIQNVSSGCTISYAEIAAQLHSAPRAVGRACGANRLPIIIPCHRVISKSGGLGGFMNASDGNPLEIKRWLLRHESA